jgi:hypothetical protein
MVRGSMAAMNPGIGMKPKGSSVADLFSRRVVASVRQAAQTLSSLFRGEQPPLVIGLASGGSFFIGSPSSARVATGLALTVAALLFLTGCSAACAV